MSVSPTASSPTGPTGGSAASGSTGVSPSIVLSRRSRHAGEQPISVLMHAALSNPDLISLAAGFVDQATLPVDTTRIAVERLLSDSARAHAALQYGTTHGDVMLRTMLLSRLAKADGMQPGDVNRSVEQVVLTAGSNQLLSFVSDALLDEGDIVLCTAPTYFVYLGVLQNLNARAVGVEMDAYGMVPESLDERLSMLAVAGELPRVKAIYVVTYFDNPCGVTLALDRRAKIVEIAKRWSMDQRIYVLEDAAYRELRYDGPDLPSLASFDPAGDTVVYTQTFSKSFSPGVRVGWGFLPQPLVNPVCALKGNFDFGSPHFAQRLIATVISEGLFEPHVETLRTAYGAKASTMLTALDEHLTGARGVSWTRPTGGLYVWLTLPESIDTSFAGPLFKKAIAAGVLYVPGDFCHPAEPNPPAKNTIRLSFGVQTPSRITQGIKILSEVIRELLAE
ncbi:MAG TPA: PLP-dependent aminotransferase family protein [Pirellulales bacterium]